jgi:hypothetical protein
MPPSTPPSTPGARRRRAVARLINEQSSLLAESALDSVAVRGAGATADAKRLLAAIDTCKAGNMETLLDLAGGMLQRDVTKDFKKTHCEDLLAALDAHATAGGIEAADRAVFGERTAEVLSAAFAIFKAIRAKEEDYMSRINACTTASVAMPAATPAAPPVDTLAPPPPPSAPPSQAPAARVRELYECARLQNGGDELPMASRPPTGRVVTVLKTIDEEGGLPPLAALCPRMQEALDAGKEAARWVMLQEFREAISAVAIATCGKTGTGHLASMTADPAVDTCPAAKDPTTGDAATVGAKIAELNAFADRVEATCCPRDGTGASPYQSRRFCQQAWTALTDGTEGLTRSLTVAARAAGVSCTSLPADKRAGGSQRQDRPERRRGNEKGDTSSSSSRSSSPERKRPKKDKKKKKAAKKRERSPSPSSDSDNSSDSFDSDWGGSRTSQRACWREVKKTGSCKDKKCDWSHRPSIVKAHRRTEGKSGAKGGKGGKKGKR